MLEKLMHLLSGKKTYIVGLIMIIGGIITGDKKLVMEGFGLITLRAGVSKAGDNKDGS